MIDWNQVNTLRDDVGRDSFDEIIEIFIEEVEEVIARVKQSPDAGSLADDLHFLKGSALNLGFTAFSSECQIGERKVASGNADQANIPLLLATYNTSKAHFLLEMANNLNP